MEEARKESSQVSKNKRSDGNQMVQQHPAVATGPPTLPADGLSPPWHPQTYAAAVGAMSQPHPSYQQGPMGPPAGQWQDRGRGRSRGEGQTGRYMGCHLCGQMDHWMRWCPNGGQVQFQMGGQAPPGYGRGQQGLHQAPFAGAAPQRGSRGGPPRGQYPVMFQGDHWISGENFSDA